MKFNNLIREYIEQIKSELDVTKIENYFRICYSKHILANDILEKLGYISNMKIVKDSIIWSNKFGDSVYKNDDIYYLICYNLNKLLYDKG